MMRDERRKIQRPASEGPAATEIRFTKGQAIVVDGGFALR